VVKVAMSSFAATLVALALSACATSPLWAQTQSVRVPPDQRALSDILSKYNDLAGEAPNDIQRKKIEAQFYQEFCARIPKGDVSGWIGDVGSVDDRGPNKSIRLDVGVNLSDIHSGQFGIVLSIGNYGAYGILKNTQPHEQTEIPVGPPLYDKVSNFRRGDAVRFSATFILYISNEACYDNINYTTYFGLVRFTSIQKLA
jgi:hypothetical protein